MPIDFALPDGSLPTRQRALLVSERIFARGGYVAASLREIADLLEIQKPALYYHFRSKEEMFLQVVAWVAEDLARLLQDLGHAPVALHAALRQQPHRAVLLLRLLVDPLPFPEHALGPALAPLEAAFDGPRNGSPGGTRLLKRLLPTLLGVVLDLHATPETGLEMARTPA